MGRTRGFIKDAIVECLSTSEWRTSRDIAAEVTRIARREVSSRTIGQTIMRNRKRMKIEKRIKDPQKHRRLYEYRLMKHDV